MFGSNFAANFGIPDFGYQNADPQGGFFGANAPATPGMIQNPAAQTPAAPAAAPGLGAQPALGSPSPLAAGALAPGGGGAVPQQQPDAPPAAAPPPAAGIGSPFGKPGL